MGALTASAVIPGTRQAISTTADGDAVLWDCVDLPEVATTDRRAVKLVKLHSGAIHALEVCGELIVTARGYCRALGQLSTVSVGAAT